MGLIADEIRQAILGSEVRDAIADGIEETERLREDYDNQVINAGNSNAEIVDARGGYTNLKARMDNSDSLMAQITQQKLDKNGIVTMANMGQDVKIAMTGGSVAVVGENMILAENVVDKQITVEKTNFVERLNFFNINDCTIGKSLRTNAGDTLETIQDSANSILANQTWRVKQGDIIRTNLTYLTFIIYDENGIYVGKYATSATEHTVSYSNSYYMRLYYGNYSNGLINTMMLTINKSLPLEYVDYNRVSLETQEVADLRKEIDIVKNGEKKSYIILDFDDPNGVYNDRYSLVYKQYGFPFTFVAMANETTGQLPVDTTKEIIQEMLSNGCDLSIYNNKLHPADSTINSTLQTDLDAWDNYVKTSKSFAEQFGFFNPVMWSSRTNLWGTALEYACKKNGFILGRGGSEGIITDYNSYLLPYVAIYTDTLSNVKTKIDEAIEGNNSILLLTHRIVDDVASDRGYDCLKTVYIEMLEYIKTKINSGLCEVVTAREFYNRNNKEKGYENDYKRLLKTAFLNQN